MSVLELDNIVLRYRERQALDGLSLSVERGEVVALLGPSGSGKTSVVRVLLGFEIPSSGVVRLDGRIANAGGRLEIRPEDRGLAVVFQDLALWPHLTVAEHLSFGLAARGMRASERARAIETILARVGLASRAASYPRELSGGERQRVAIARALVLDPPAVLLDEPLANLDVVLRSELLQLFRALLQARGTAALYVTHDLREAAALGGRIAVLEQGRIVQTGSLEDLCDSPATDFVRRLVDDFKG